MPCRCEVVDLVENPCDSEPCWNDGICVLNSTNTDFYCNCKPGWEGPTCEVNVDDCVNDFKCLGGGKCLDDIDTYKCLCTEERKGPRCEFLASSCYEGLGKCDVENEICLPGYNSEREHCINKSNAIEMPYNIEDDGATVENLVDFFNKFINFQAFPNGSELGIDELLLTTIFPQLTPFSSSTQLAAIQHEEDLTFVFTLGRDLKYEGRNDQFILPNGTTITNFYSENFLKEGTMFNLPRGIELTFRNERSKLSEGAFFTLPKSFSYRKINDGALLSIGDTFTLPVGTLYRNAGKTNELDSSSYFTILRKHANVVANLYQREKENRKENDFTLDFDEELIKLDDKSVYVLPAGSVVLNGQKDVKVFVGGTMFTLPRGTLFTSTDTRLMLDNSVKLKFPIGSDFENTQTGRLLSTGATFKLPIGTLVETIDENYIVRWGDVFSLPKTDEDIRKTFGIYTLDVDTGFIGDVSMVGTEFTLPTGTSIINALNEGRVLGYGTGFTFPSGTCMIEPNSNRMSTDGMVFSLEPGSYMSLGQTKSLEDEIGFTLPHGTSYISPTKSENVALGTTFLLPSQQIKYFANIAQRTLSKGFSRPVILKNNVQYNIGTGLSLLLPKGTAILGSGNQDYLTILSKFILPRGIRTDSSIVNDETIFSLPLKFINNINKDNNNYNINENKVLQGFPADEKIRSFSVPRGFIYINGQEVKTLSKEVHYSTPNDLYMGETLDAYLPAAYKLMQDIAVYTTADKNTGKIILPQNTILFNDLTEDLIYQNVRLMLPMKTIFNDVSINEKVGKAAIFSLENNESYKFLNSSSTSKNSHYTIPKGVSFANLENIGTFENDETYVVASTELSESNTASVFGLHTLTENMQFSDGTKSIVLPRAITFLNGFVNDTIVRGAKFMLPSVSTFSDKEIKTLITRDTVFSLPIGMNRAFKNTSKLISDKLSFQLDKGTIYMKGDRQGIFNKNVEFTLPSKLFLSVNLDPFLAPIYTLPKDTVIREIINNNNETTDVLTLPMGTSVIGGIDKKLRKGNVKFMLPKNTKTQNAAVKDNIGMSPLFLFDGKDKRFVVSLGNTLSTGNLSYKLPRGTSFVNTDEKGVLENDVTYSVPMGSHLQKMITETLGFPAPFTLKSTTEYSADSLESHIRFPLGTTFLSGFDMNGISGNVKFMLPAGVSFQGQSNALLNDNTVYSLPLQLKDINFNNAGESLDERNSFELLAGTVYINDGQKGTLDTPYSFSVPNNIFSAIDFRPFRTAIYTLPEDITISEADGQKVTLTLPMGTSVIGTFDNTFSTQNIQFMLPEETVFANYSVTNMLGQNPVFLFSGDNNNYLARASHSDVRNSNYKLPAGITFVNRNQDGTLFQDMSYSVSNKAKSDLTDNQFDNSMPNMLKFNTEFSTGEAETTIFFPLGTTFLNNFSGSLPGTSKFMLPTIDNEPNTYLNKDTVYSLPISWQDIILHNTGRNITSVHSMMLPVGTICMNNGKIGTLATGVNVTFPKELFSASNMGTFLPPLYQLPLDINLNYSGPIPGGSISGLTLPKGSFIIGGFNNKFTSTENRFVLPVDTSFYDDTIKDLLGNNPIFSFNGEVTYSVSNVLGMSRNKANYILPAGLNFMNINGNSTIQNDISYSPFTFTIPNTNVTEGFTQHLQLISQYDNEQDVRQSPFVLQNNTEFFDGDLLLMRLPRGTLILRGYADFNNEYYLSQNAKFMLPIDITFDNEDRTLNKVNTIFSLNKKVKQNSLFATTKQNTFMLPTGLRYINSNGTGLLSKPVSFTAPTKLLLEPNLTKYLPQTFKLSEDFIIEDKKQSSQFLRLPKETVVVGATQGKKNSVPQNFILPVDTTFLNPIITDSFEPYVIFSVPPNPQFKMTAAPSVSQFNYSLPVGLTYFNKDQNYQLPISISYSIPTEANTINVNISTQTNKPSILSENMAFRLTVNSGNVSVESDLNLPKGTYFLSGYHDSILDNGATFLLPKKIMFKKGQLSKLPQPITFSLPLNMISSNSGRSSSDYFSLPIGIKYSSRLGTGSLPSPATFSINRIENFHLETQENQKYILPKDELFTRESNFGIDDSFSFVLPKWTIFLNGFTSGNISTEIQFVLPAAIKLAGVTGLDIPEGF